MAQGKVGGYCQYVVYERRRVYVQYVIFYKSDRPVPHLPASTVPCRGLTDRLSQPGRRHRRSGSSSGRQSDSDDDTSSNNDDVDCDTDETDETVELRRQQHRTRVKVNPSDERDERFELQTAPTVDQGQQQRHSSVDSFLPPVKPTVCSAPASVTHSLGTQALPLTLSGQYMLTAANTVGLLQLFATLSVFTAIMCWLKSVVNDAFSAHCQHVMVL